MISQIELEPELHGRKLLQVCNTFKLSSLGKPLHFLQVLGMYVLCCISDGNLQRTRTSGRAAAEGHRIRFTA